MVTIEGHCDERGTAEHNLALGASSARWPAKRALSGVRSPILGGSRLRTTVSYGKESFRSTQATTSTGIREESPGAFRDHRQIAYDAESFHDYDPHRRRLRGASRTGRRRRLLETRQMMADIRMLQEQSQQLQSLIGQLTDALKTLDTRMEARIDDQTNTTRKALADQKLVVDSVSSELRVLREKADDNNVRVGSLTQEVAALRQLVTQFGTSRSSAPPADDPAATSPSTADASGAPSVAGASPGQIFSSALTDYYSGDYALADPGLRKAYQEPPRAPKIPLTRFLDIGTCYLNDGKYKQAVDA